MSLTTEPTSQSSKTRFHSFVAVCHTEDVDISKYQNYTSNTEHCLCSSLDRSSASKRTDLQQWIISQLGKVKIFLL